MEDRDFKGIWIPKEVWTDSNLTFLEKAILMEIDSLDNGEGCYATNKYLADFCQCSERKVSDAIFKLSDYGVVIVEYNDNRQRRIYSTLTPRKKCEGGSKNCEGGRKKCEPPSKNCDQRNIYKNNKQETVLENIPPIVPPEGKRFVKPSVEEVKAYCLERANGINAEEFVDYYESVGWKVGAKKPMKDWKATVRYWESTRKKKNPVQKSFADMADEIEREMHDTSRYF